MESPGVLSIRRGVRVAEIVPELGGALAAFYDDGEQRRDWLRPATPDALATRDPLGMASFVLVPWCNRIRDGRFSWGGREIALAPSSPQAHALHGTGWVLPWQIVEREPHRLALELDRPATPQWPFAFRARQVYALGERGLAVTVSLMNRGTSTMPGGIGHHPYFAHRREGAGTCLQADVRAIWRGDAERLPTELETGAPEVDALRAGMRVADHVLDNNFTGFDRVATIAWPDGYGVRMRAEPPLDYFVLYSPAEADHFCAEAVSNCADWINFKAVNPGVPVGGQVLAPGESIEATTWFEPFRSDGDIDGG